MKVKLRNKKLTTIGGSEGFIVDKAFINNGQLEKDKEYNLDITPSKHIEPMKKKHPDSYLSDKAKFLKDNELEG
ncbi:hypothetical protein LCGC14_0570120 [marine sediment metagenome]|uniref:Uncharacterized protein n=1 Tax=marine sediment metagenome TaxID=412755 RepID=A0A0F9RJK1_9ZZZZ